jgi:bifunctional UDP-N-acetylglucosamine pyrophosphorylase/glucosamine-1-phosphate N-acetyltransferase
MDVIILAAGKGTRLRPYTEKIPKPLLPVQGRPILDWIIGALPPFDRLIVVVNYLGEQIEHYLQQQQHVKNWTTVRQEVPRGTGDALMACRPAISPHTQSVMVLNGDDLIGRNDLLALLRSPGSGGILTHPVDQPQDFGIVTPTASGMLKSIIEKPQGLTPPQLANIGGYVFPRRVFDLTLPLSARGEFEITDAVSMLAEAGDFAVVTAQYWLPIGNVEQWCWSQLAELGPVR